MFFLLLLTYIMVSFMTVQVDVIGFFTHKQPRQSKLQKKRNRIFQVEFLCSVTLNLTFTFKYVNSFNFGFCFLMC